MYSKARTIGKIKNIIAITGLPSAGKSAASVYISEKLRIDHYSLRETKKEIIIQSEERSAVVDAVEDPTAIAYFKEEANMVLIALVAEPQIRYKRWTDRRGFVEALTYESFLQKEATNTAASEQVQSCISMADYVIPNNGTRDELYEALDELLAKVDTRKLR